MCQARFLVHSADRNNVMEQAGPCRKNSTGAGKCARIYACVRPQSTLGRSSASVRRHPLHAGALRASLPFAPSCLARGRVAHLQTRWAKTHTRQAFSGAGSLGSPALGAASCLTVSIGSDAPSDLQSVGRGCSRRGRQEVSGGWVCPVALGAAGSAGPTVRLQASTGWQENAQTGWTRTVA